MSEKEPKIEKDKKDKDFGKEYFHQEAVEAQERIKYSPEERSAFKFEQIEEIKDFLDDMHERILVINGKEHLEKNYASMGLEESQVENFSYVEIKNMLDTMNLDETLGNNDLFRELVVLKKSSNMKKLNFGDKILLFKRIAELQDNVEKSLSQISGSEELLEQDKSKVQPLQESLWNSLRGKKIANEALKLIPERDRNILSMTREAWMEQEYKKETLSSIWELVPDDDDKKKINDSYLKAQKDFIQKNLEDLKKVVDFSDVTVKDLMSMEEISSLWNLIPDSGGKKEIDEANSKAREDFINKKIEDIKQKTGRKFNCEDIIYINDNGIDLEDEEGKPLKFNLFEQSFSKRKTTLKEKLMFTKVKPDVVKIGDRELSLSSIKIANFNNSVEKYHKSQKETKFGSKWDKTNEIWIKGKESLINELMAEDPIGATKNYFERVKMLAVREYLTNKVKKENKISKQEVDSFVDALGDDFEKSLNYLAAGGDFQTIIDNYPDEEVRNYFKSSKVANKNGFSTFFLGMLDYLINFK